MHSSDWVLPAVKTSRKPRCGLGGPLSVATQRRDGVLALTTWQRARRTTPRKRSDGFGGERRRAIQSRKKLWARCTRMETALPETMCRRTDGLNWLLRERGRRNMLMKECRQRDLKKWSWSFEISWP